MTLRVAGHGIATAYATVAVGEVADEMAVARKAVSHFKETSRNRNQISEPETIFLLGQADIATMVETTNFSRVFDLGYPGAKSRASGVNWVFSAPLELGIARQPPKAAFRFILHLRLNRAIYAYADIEEAIVQRILLLLGRNRRGARIHIGLGWTDLLIDGWFTHATFRELTQFIINLHGVRLKFGARTEDSIPILRRLLTVVGYVGDPPAFPDFGHLTFLRAIPGQYNEISRRVQPYGDVRILDGKADFLVISEPGTVAENWLAEQKKLGEATNRPFLRKVETHLMYFKASDFTNDPDDDDLIINIGDRRLHVDRCSCDVPDGKGVLEGDGLMRKLVLRRIRELLEYVTEHRGLPAERRYAIDNALFLLALTLRDSSICCDTRDAVMASYEGLATILERIKKLITKQPSGGLDKQHRLIVSAWRAVDEWHRLTELLLRQRTVGSYEEILGQSDRAVVYSGGVQKFLYMADQLLIDFVNRIWRDVPESYRAVGIPRFATMYDSVKTALSHHTGLIRIPTSNIFAFPLVVPDLWHEVASHLYFLWLASKVTEYAQQSSEAGSVNDFVAQVGDHFADVIVYLYGFGGDFDRFLASLVDVWRRTYDKRPRRDRTYAARAQLIAPGAIAQLLLRAYLIREFHEIRGIRRQLDASVAEAFKPEIVVPRLTAALRNRLAADYADLGDANWVELTENVCKKAFSEVHRELYLPYLDADATISNPSLARFEDGEIVHMTRSDDLNDYFGALATYLQSPTLADDFRVFQTEAALGESAAIEYHRRQMSAE